ncbi:hypothetical protein [Pedobacter chinensis]|uniref:hypothetical protein n=1 Tax=Pedobacter chinensis TaxID=2282421 RepID=UPI002692EAC0|nr:hypothetical protein [Pedobacter chinensis]
MGEGQEIIRHESLFSRIGGFDLATEWCGLDNAFHCEICECIGGLPETQKMLDFCAEYNITAGIELIDIKDIHIAFDKMEKEIFVAVS